MLREKNEGGVVGIGVSVLLDDHRTSRRNRRGGLSLWRRKQNIVQLFTHHYNITFRIYKMLFGTEVELALVRIVAFLGTKKMSFFPFYSKSSVEENRRWTAFKQEKRFKCVLVG